MLFSWGVTLAVLLMINLVTAWQLPLITQSILISPFVVFSSFLTVRKRDGASRKKTVTALAVMLMALIAVGFGMFSEQHYMIAGAIAVSLPIVLAVYLIFM